MQILLRYSVLLGLLLLPGVSAAGKPNRLAGVAPDRLVELKTLLTGASRVEVRLWSGITRQGQIAAVSSNEIILRVRSHRRGPFQVETVRTEQISHLRLSSTPKPSWKSRVGRKLGFAVGLIVAFPIAIQAGSAGHGVPAWASIIMIPTLGALTGEQLARQPQETIIPVLPGKLGDAAEPRPLLF